MHKKFGTWLAVAATVLMTACGGGGSDSGNSGFGGGSTTSTVSDLVLTLSTQQLVNTGLETVTATATAVDGNRNAVSGANVTFAVNNNAVASVGSSSTDSSGKAAATVGIGSDRSNRIITVTVTSGSLSRSATILVTGTKITATLTSTVVPGGAGYVNYKVSDSNSNALPGQEVVVTAPGLAGATGVTNSSGEYRFDFTAPTTSGPLTITATAGGVSLNQTVQVQSTNSNIPVAVGPVTSASLSANPKTVPVNSTGTSNQSEIRALFVAAANRPVENVRVRFELPDPNSIGGTISAGSNLLYSSTNGIVSTSYVPGTRSSPTDGVTVRACWDYSDFAVGVCPNSVDVKLTVTAEPLSVSIGANGSIAEGTDKLTYVLDYVVMVVNSAGFAMSNVAVSATLDLPAYYKGRWNLANGAWGQTITASCANEDVDRNGVLSIAEDINGSGSIEPRKADASLSFNGSNLTNSNGMVFLRLVYPQDKASWVSYGITVSANGVAGTEGTAQFSGLTKVPSDVLAITTATPAFWLSPYGQSNSCANPN